MVDVLSTGEKHRPSPLASEGTTQYGSDGEIPPLSSHRVNDDDDSGSDDSGEATPLSPRTGDVQPAGEENTTDRQCGLLYCGRKILELLPSIGEGPEGSAEFEEELRHGAWQVIQLIIPVTICMAVVVFFQLTVAVNITGPQSKPIYLPLNEDSSSGGVNFVFGLVNALVFLAIVIVMTTLLVCLFKYKCYRAISVWLVTASGLLLFVISSTYFVEIMVVQKLVIDWFSFVFIIWNFGVMGLMVIHWKGPLRLQQAYLILISALVAIVLIQNLPDWTAWIILAVISVYDLFAVLCPKGPLRILVETAKERGGSLFPSLIYSSTMIWLPIVGMADSEDKKKDKDKNKDKEDEKFPKTRPERSEEDVKIDSDEDDSDRTAAAQGMARRDHRTPDETRRRRRGAREGEREQEGNEGGEEDDEDEQRGPKLGLGDFIFYSVLVGKAAHTSEGNWVIISSCFVAILIGLCLTSLILGIVRRALPALPFSIFFGLVFYFSSQYVIAPFMEVLNLREVFV